MRPPSTMNTRMGTVFTGLAAGFVGIIAMLTWWQVIVAGELKQKDENNQTAYYEQRVERGFIVTADGVRLAGRSKETGANGDTIWQRRYPEGSLAAHVLGYDTRAHSRTGVERAMNDVLTGSTRNLGAVLGLLDGDEAQIGDDVHLTINAKAQRIAERELAATGSPGSLVALDPQSGKVLAMASYPTFSASRLLRNFSSAARGDALFNRATQAALPPGSTFKVVTASAALEAGLVTPDSTFPGGSSYKTASGPIQNFGGASFGSHDLTYALTNSINTTFAEIGVKLGDAKLRAQMAAFGFFEKPPVYGLPANEVRASGLTGEDGTPLPDGTNFDEARTAIGQDKLTVSPLQMALVAAAIGNQGAVPVPTVIDRVTRAGSRSVVSRPTPKAWKQAISPETARQLTDMMKNVVTSGSGTAAKIPGVEVAGKTGTADTPSGNVTWFIAFAPAEHPTVAIAVAIEGQASGTTGGVKSAPIARMVLEALLGTGGE